LHFLRAAILTLESDSDTCRRQDRLSCSDQTAGKLAYISGAYLPYSLCNDADMVRIGRLSGLVRLELGQTSVTDLGLIQLSGLTKLEDLEQAARGTRRTRSNTVTY
jgi:hypothetical protein